ncbi:(6-4)DNA photolyase [Tetrabaena socialis]|uniref:(6-4)DNA photolyase n=1 Tax=Tetrabaena socialis TaxID=47790 RepID=A0A2J8ACP2_9CHLO|nr:(6-4)DNA photolyase [Tetrabaena socialis]|eukprot:PNH10276.1 (6-4)DNA photolyase [Tetrabaena socialis]
MASASASAGAKVSIVWFRKGLRVHDNPALIEACRDAAHVYPIFQSSYKVTVNRYNFLLESLRDLDNSFRARGSRLLVLRGKPEEVLPRVFREWGAKQLCFEVDTEPYAKARDARVHQLAAEAGVEVHAAVSHTLYDTEMLVARHGGSPPLTMQSFTKLVDRVGDPPPPAPDPPAAIPPPAPGMPAADPAATGVPTWQEVGFTEAPVTIFKGGETEALRRLDASFADPKWVAGFQKPDTNPAAFERPATTVLSPYLKFGCLSARLFHARLLAVYREHKAHTQPPVSLRGQLLWREFFYTVGAHTPNFDRMVGNPICKQIPWDTNEEFYNAWREARTGEQLPAPDSGAGRTCKAREVVDHYINAANWMWLSASAFFSQYFRVYSPVTFGKKVYDPSGAFIRRFLPVLKDMPAKYIYEPWTAPLEVQRRAGCVVGVDYPRPILDHAVVSKRNTARMAEAYRANKCVAGPGGVVDELA